MEHHHRMPEKKPRKPRPSVAANMVKKLLVGMPQRLLDAPSHGRALHEWCERVRSALRTLGEAPPSTRPVDVDIANLARVLLDKFEPQRSEGNAPQAAQRPRSRTAGAVRPDPQARSAIQDLMYTPVVHSRPPIAASTTDTSPSASRT